IVRSIGVDLVSILQFRYLSPLGMPSEERIFQIQKVALTNNRAYIVTASQIPESELKRNDRLRGDLDKIMSSFAFVTLVLLDNLSSLICHKLIELQAHDLPCSS